MPFGNRDPMLISACSCRVRFHLLLIQKKSSDAQTPPLADFVAIARGASVRSVARGLGLTQPGLPQAASSACMEAAAARNTTASRFLWVALSLAAG